MELYHLSKISDLTHLDPRMPKCAIPKYEDTETERICFSETIDGALSALQDSPNDFYVYIPSNELTESDVHRPSVDEVRDAKYTKEVWVMYSIPVKCIGKVKSYQYNNTKDFYSGRGRVTVFYYPYEWMERYD